MFVRVDHVNGATPHLKARDVTLCAISEPMAKIQAFKKRMGWQLSWVSSLGSDFNYDFGVSYTPEQLAAGKKDYNFGSIVPYGEENHGLSVFAKNAGGEVFHTYSTFGVAASRLSARISCSIWSPRDATKRAWPFPWNGFATTISTSRSCRFPIRRATRNR